MPDLAPHRTAPLADIILHAAPGLVEAGLAPPASRFLFRGDDPAATACGNALGAAFPREVNCAAVAGDRAALWLGPDEWLLIMPKDEAATVGAALTTALISLPHSLVDVSHRQLAIEVSGPKAADLLNTCVLLDLDEASFPVGACTRTIFAKAEIVLWRTAKMAFRVEVWRSFAPYLAGLLEEASRGLP